MNVKELKNRAKAWDWAISGSILKADCARQMFEAIMALPDDPQAEHEDLVEMAGKCLRNDRDSSVTVVLNTVIERFGKREPDPALGSPECWGALYRRVAILESKLTRLARLTGTEEV